MKENLEKKVAKNILNRILCWWFKEDKENPIRELYRKGRESELKTMGKLKFGEPKPPEDLEALKERISGPTNIEEALEEHKTQITNWYHAYLKYATGEENDISLLEDFQRDVERDLQPKLRRYRECEQLTYKQYQDFQAWIVVTLQSFRADLGKVEQKRREDDPIITLLKNLNLTDGQKKAVVEYLKSECGGNCENCHKGETHG